MSEHFDSDENMKEIDDGEIELDDDEFDEKETKFAIAQAAAAAAAGGTGEQSVILNAGNTYQV